MAENTNFHSWFSLVIAYLRGRYFIKTLIFRINYLIWFNFIINSIYDSNFYLIHINFLHLTLDPYLILQDLIILSINQMTNWFLFLYFFNLNNLWYCDANNWNNEVTMCYYYDRYLEFVMWFLNLSLRLGTPKHFPPLIPLFPLLVPKPTTITNQIHLKQVQ